MAKLFLRFVGEIFFAHKCSKGEFGFSQEVAKGENGMIYLNVEDVARGLGFVEVKINRVAKSVDTSVDNHPTYIMWNRINRYLTDFDYPSVKAGDFIPENIFYLLAMKASNEAAKTFQLKIANEILPTIRKHGMYINPNAPINPNFLRTNRLPCGEGNQRGSSKKLFPFAGNFLFRMFKFTFSDNYKL